MFLPLPSTWFTPCRDTRTTYPVNRVGGETQPDEAGSPRKGAPATFGEEKASVSPGVNGLSE